MISSIANGRSGQRIRRVSAAVTSLLHGGAPQRLARAASVSSGKVTGQTSLRCSTVGPASRCSSLFSSASAAGVRDISPRAEPSPMGHAAGRLSGLSEARLSSSAPGLGVVRDALCRGPPRSGASAPYRAAESQSAPGRKVTHLTSRADGDSPGRAGVLETQFVPSSPVICFARAADVGCMSLAQSPSSYRRLRTRSRSSYCAYTPSRRSDAVQVAAAAVLTAGARRCTSGSASTCRSCSRRRSIQLRRRPRAGCRLPDAVRDDLTLTSPDCCRCLRTARRGEGPVAAP